MMPPTKSNPSGYWENNDIVTVHEILLRDLHSRWDRIGSFSDGWMESEAADKARQSIQALIDSHYTGKGLWVIKDPRMCRLMPLWETILREKGLRPGFVVTVRHPLETAGSLSKRDGFSLEKGLLLWLIYNREAFAACQNRPNAMITYDQLLQDPVNTLRKIEIKLNITFPKNMQKVYPDILTFIEPSLRSHHAGGQSDEHADQYAHFTHLYKLVRSMCIDGPAHVPASAELDPATATFPFFLPGHSQAEKNTNHLFDDLLRKIGDLERDGYSAEAASRGQ